MLSRSGRACAVVAVALSAAVTLTVLSSTSGAQPAAVTTIPMVGSDSGPAISDDGNVVVFVSGDASAATSIVVHDRAAATTNVVAGSAGGVTPAISGNGCIVAWVVPGEASGPPDAVPVDSVPAASVPVEVATPWRLLWSDLCASVTPTAPLAIEIDPAVDTIGRPALSFSGGTIAVSTGDAVRTFVRAGSAPFAPQAVFDGVGTGQPSTLRFTDPVVDISDNGEVVVFAGGTDLDEPASVNVYRRAAGAVSLLATSGRHPSVSGDGGTVAFARMVPQPGGDESVSTVFVVDGSLSTPAPPIQLAPGQLPTISADGNHVVFSSLVGAGVASRIGQGGVAFAAVDTFELTGVPGPLVSAPAIDRYATTVATDAEAAAGVGDPATESAPDITLSELAAEVAFDAARFDLGSGDIGAVLSATATVTNAGPATFAISNVAVDGAFRIASESCTPFLRPQSTCEIVVTFTVERLEDAFADVVVTGVGRPGAVPQVTGEVTALGVAPIDTTTSAPSTTTPASTTGGSTTGGSSTGGSTTGASTTGGTTRGTSTTRGTTTTTTTITTTTSVAGAGLSFSPAAFEFAPTIIEAGRRIGLVELVNSSSAAQTVIGVRLEPADAGFEIVETTCAGETVAAGGRCAVRIAFAPSTQGPVLASLVASVGNGAQLTVPVSGVGAPAPRLDVIPGVANPGQVVTLQGSGFPTGLTVQVGWNNTVDEVVVTENGTFNLPVVVLPNLSSGPVDVSVAAQVDQFAEVTATVLVSTAGGRSSSAVLRGVGPSIFR